MAAEGREIVRVEGEEVSLDTYLSLAARPAKARKRKGTGQIVIGTATFAIGVIAIVGANGSDNRVLDAADTGLTLAGASGLLLGALWFGFGKSNTNAAEADLEAIEAQRPKASVAPPRSMVEEKPERRVAMPPALTLPLLALRF